MDLLTHDTHAPHFRQFTNNEVEDADFRQVANPLSCNVLPDNCTRGEAIEHLSRTFPMNEYGLPLYYIRSDLLDINGGLVRGMVNQDELDGACELLYYTDGYPCYKSGSPFWTQMRHETRQAYLLFQRFLDLAEQEGIRLIDTLAEEEVIELATIREYHKEFYWSSRSRAYDLYIVAAEAKKREVRTRKMENSHYTVAGSVLDALIGRINNEPELIAHMDVSTLFETLEKMVKIQRLSLGLTGQNASSTQKDLSAPGSSVEVLFRQLTKNMGVNDQGAESLQTRLSLLMADEDTALSVQQLIVRATGAGDRS